MCSIHSISRYNDFVLDLQDSSEVHSYQPVMNKVVSCKDSSGTIINDIHLLKLCYAIGCFDSRTRSSMAQCAISLTATYTRLPCSQWRLAANNRHRSVLAPMAPLAAWRLLTFVQGDRLQRQPITDMAAYSALRC